MGERSEPLKQLKTESDIKMAKKGSEMAIIKEQTTITLGALSGLDVAAQAGPTLLAGYRIIKTVWSATVIGLTVGEGVGLVLGIANNDLSAAEIEESLETNGPVNRGDRDREELAGRFTKIIGESRDITNGANVELPVVGPNGGAPVETILRWSFPLGTGGWKWFIYNLGTGVTTGATVRIIATHYGVWLN